MEILVFLLGTAFGMTLSNLMIYIGRVREHGLTENLVIDLLHEIASIIFILALFYAYVIGIAPLMTK